MLNHLPICGANSIEECYRKFCIFHQSIVMNEEELKKLEIEVERLAAQLRQQHQEILTLRQQLKKLNPGSSDETIKAPSHPINSLRPPSLENLIGLRFIHLIGIVVLVIGLSLGVKYAIDKNLISEGMRIILAYGAGGVLLALSVRLKKDYAGFSAILFSGAMASVYFTTYGAYVYYNFLSFTVAFAIMIALTIFTAYQALLYNRQEIALLGLVGAYGIPFLISPNRGQAELLFLYITIINCGVVFICAKRSWAIVGRAAQGISWLLFIGWAALQNDVGLRSYGLIFMVLFFILFAINALSPKLFRKGAFSSTATYQLLTNNVLFYIAALYVFGYSFSNSSIALITGLFSFFAATQAVLFYLWNEKIGSRLTGYYALILFVIFIGFNWSGITVTLLWLLTAVIIFIAGVRFKSIAVRMSAIALMGTTLLKLLVLDSLTFSTLQKVIAYLVLGVLLLLVSFYYQKFKEQLFD
ncbi:MAG: hypothetical protein JWR72_1986 [Flavisolibacter sp.]|nr:hypothetical protein [Flavisolibacter sp.]